MVGIKYSEFKFQTERVGRPMRVYIEEAAHFNVAVKPSSLQFFDCVTSACDRDGLLIAEHATPRNLDPRGNFATGQGLPKFNNGNGPAMSKLKAKGQQRVASRQQQAQAGLDASKAEVKRRYRQYNFDRKHPGAGAEVERTRSALKTDPPTPSPAIVRRIAAQQTRKQERIKAVEAQNAKLGATKHPVVSVVSHDLQVIGRDNAAKSHEHQHLFKGKPVDKSESEKSFGAITDEKDVNGGHCNKDINADREYPSDPCN